MSEMIERVTDAIMRANFSRPVDLQGINVSVPDNEDLARAAIGAMREPTVPMVNRARSDKPYDQDCEISWKLMIDEALK